MLFIVLLSVMSFFFPLAIFTFELKGLSIYEVYGFFPKSVESLAQSKPEYALIIMQVVISIIVLVSIFLYKKRPLQIKVLAGAFLITAIYIAVLFFFKIDGIEKEISILAQPKVSYGIASYLSILQLFLLILAQRAIRKDERMVRSSERLR